MAKNTKVLIDQATLDFFTAESLQIHALCDRADVPREVEGEVLSMAQRVSVLEGVYRGLLQRTLGVTLHPLQ